jgi:hypothetical protein
VVYVFEFFQAASDGSRFLVDTQKHRAKSADAADHRARTIIKNVILGGKIANLCVIKDQTGGLVREVVIEAARASESSPQVA